MKIYSQEAVDKLFDKWEEMGGDINIIGEGCLLAFDLAILTKEGYKSIVIKEQYLNEWNSGYKARQYKKLPKKYAIL